MPHTGEWAGRGRAACHTRPPLTACDPPPERHFQLLSRRRCSHLPDFLWHNMKSCPPPCGPRGPSETQKHDPAVLAPCVCLDFISPWSLGHRWPTPRPCPSTQTRHGQSGELYSGHTRACGPASPTHRPPMALRLRWLLAGHPWALSLGDP